MTILKFEISKLNMSLKKPFITALRRVDAIEDIIIKIHTDTDLVGYGEACAVTAITGTTNAQILKELNQEIFPALMHQNIEAEKVFTLLHQLRTSPEAKACVDIALYDLLAKEAKLSLHRYLGAQHTHLQTDLTISVNTPQIMKEESLKAFQAGFSILKVKLDDNLEQNIQRVKAINTVITPQVKLRLDPNQALNLQSCLQMLQAIPTHNIECIEQPFVAEDIEAMKKLKAKEIVPVLADESLFSLDDAQSLLQDEAVDSLNIKLMKCGGIHTAIKIAKLAYSYHKECMIGSMLEGPISLLAAAHFGLSQSNISMADLDSPLYLKEHPLLSPFHLQNDTINLDEETQGLGIDSIIQDLHFFPTP